MFSGEPLDPGPIFGPLLLLLLVAFLIVLPIGLVWRARQGVRHFRQGYYEGRTTGMTETEVQAYDQRTPFVVEYWWAFAIVALVVAIMTVPYISPGVLALILYRLFTPKKTRRMISDDQSSVRPGRVLDLGDSARERDRGRPDAE